jgi:hypothetical protein
VSVFRQSGTTHLARRSCRHCPALAAAGSDTCAAHAGEAGRLSADPRRAGYKSSAYRIARRSAIRRANGHCEACGATLPRRPDGGLVCQTHHRDEDPMNNPPDGSNLLVCCLACHSGGRRPS